MSKLVDADAADKLSYKWDSLLDDDSCCNSRQRNKRKNRVAIWRNGKELTFPLLATNCFVRTCSFMEERKSGACLEINPQTSDNTENEEKLCLLYQ
jgi:hypothetical protein